MRHLATSASVAELVIGEVVAPARQLCTRSGEVHRGVGQKTAENFYEMRKTTLGIIAHGHIGSQVGVLAKAIGLWVVAYDSATKLALGNVSMLAKISEVLAQTNFVSLHVFETPRHPKA